MNKAAGKVIKAFREHLNYNLEYVANRLNISIALLTNIESGEVGLEIEKLYHLSKLFGVVPLVIFDIIEEVYHDKEGYSLDNAIIELKIN